VRPRSPFRYVRNGIYPEMVTSLAMASDPHDIMDELQVSDLGQPAADAANPHPGQSLTARALRSLPEGWHAVLWPGEPDEATPAQIAELLRLTDSGTAALSHRALDGLRAAYLRIYLDELARPECRPAAGKLSGHVRCALSRRDTRLVSRHLGGCAQCGVIYADLVTMDAVLRGVIAPLILGGTGPYPAAQPAPAAALAPRLRRAGRGQRRAALAAGAALALAAVAVVATMLTLNSRPARNARHPAAAGSPAATPPAQPSGRPGSAGPSPSSAAITGLVRPRRTRSAAASSRPGRGASQPPSPTAPLPSSSATLGSPAPPPAPSPSPPCLVLPPLRLC
jgi:HAMP domain-containing protein